MEVFLDRLILIYNIVSCVAVILYPFLCPKVQKNENESKNVSEDTWKSRFSVFMLILVLIVGFILLTYAVFNRIIWIVIPTVALVYLERTNQVYDSLSVIRETINKKGLEALSKRETDAIIMLTTAIIMFNVYKVPQRLVRFLLKIPNEMVSDWATVFVLVFIVTIICFLIGVLLILPFKAIVKLTSWIKPRTKKFQIKKIVEKYKTYQGKIVWDDFLSVQFIEWTLKKNSTMRVCWVLLVFIIPVDVCIKIVLIGVGELSALIEYPIIIIRRICKTITRMVKWLKSVSDRKIINIIFRIAFVISVSLVVIVNRYDSFLHNIEAGTSIMEFIASAIVIPMILAWIIEYKSETQNHE